MFAGTVHAASASQFWRLFDPSSGCGIAPVTPFERSFAMCRPLHLLLCLTLCLLATGCGQSPPADTKPAESSPRAAHTLAAIDVYCVEHGRWGLRAAEHNLVVTRAFVADREQAPELAAKASEGKFAASAGYLNKASRLATQAGDGQTAVWERVAQANLASGIQADSGAFAHNYVDTGVLEQLQPYIDALAKPVAGQERIVGVIVAINGKTESLDVYESTPLFAKLWPKLLRSYALDALHVANPDKSPQQCSTADATAFLKEVLQAGVERTDETGGGLVVTRRSSDSVLSFSAGEASPAAGRFGSGGFVGGVHTAGFSK
jgi:hypothetical protein